MWSINEKEENEIKFEITKKWCIKWENYINVIEGCFVWKLE